ncbi:MAG: prolipoprotein diacylglyceryl transferase family protein [Polyangiaceae bacterium]
MIPFIHVPSGHIGPLPIHPFGVLVALAIWVGTTLAVRRARVVGIDRAVLQSLLEWVLVCGFLGGHVLDILFYRPETIAEDPLHLLAIWNGQGSFGGFLGALLGALAWRARTRSVALLPLAEVILSALPFGWAIGRLGCSLAHDHPGRLAPANVPLAVGYGAPLHVTTLPLGVELRYGASPRFDMGFMELLASVAISLALLATFRRRRAPWFYVAFVLLAYSPVRFLLDFLRAEDVARPDARYWALTPAQWCCLIVAGFGLYALARWRRAVRTQVAEAGSTV